MRGLGGVEAGTGVYGGSGAGLADRRLRSAAGVNQARGRPYWADGGALNEHLDTPSLRAGGGGNEEEEEEEEADIS